MAAEYPTPAMRKRGVAVFTLKSSHIATFQSYILVGYD